jgi:hypothetical protein
MIPPKYIMVFLLFLLVASLSWSAYGVPSTEKVYVVASGYATCKGVWVATSDEVVHFRWPIKGCKKKLRGLITKDLLEQGFFKRGTPS